MVGIVTCNPVTIVSGIFDLLVMGSGIFGPKSVTTNELADKMKKMSSSLDLIDQQLDDLTKVTSELTLTVRANTIIAQLTPSTSTVGALW